MNETAEALKEAQRARNRKWWAANSERMKAKKSTPEYREKRRQWREAYLSHPENRNRKREACKRYQQETQHGKKRQANNLKAFQAYKETLSCSICGLLGGPEGHMICFHHRDPTQKEHNIGLLAQGYWGKPKLQAELEKCIPLCYNCHAHLHWELKQQEKVEESTPRLLPPLRSSLQPEAQPPAPGGV